VIVRPRPYHLGKGIVVYEEGSSGLVAGDRLVSSQISNPRDGMALVEAKPIGAGTPLGSSSARVTPIAPAPSSITPEATP
jgi:hypothetical protein